MLKKVIAVVLIVLAAGSWFYLDRLNKEELRLAESARQEMIKARAEAAARAEAMARFEAQIKTELETCKAEAEKARDASLEASKIPVKRKPGQFTLPPAAQAKAEQALATAYAACQSSYDSRRAGGM